MVAITQVLRNPMSGLTHFIGVLLAVAGLVALLVRAAGGDAMLVASFAIYGATLILLYTFSTLYHWLPLGERGVAIMRKIDHLMIFIFIAGTYTPICLTVLRGFWGWVLFGVIWGLAAAGVVTKFLWMNAPRPVYVGLYIAMGWTALVFMVPLSRVMPPGGLAWLLAGGLLYSVGAVCYTLRRPDPFPGFFGFHEVWHLFVMAGSLAHYVMIYRLPL